MKKKIIALIIVIVCMLTLVSCGSDNSAEQQTEEEKLGIEKVGSYYFYETDDKNEYLNFLHEFDDTKYEIIDISIEDANLSTREYCITYKEISE